MNTSSRSPGNVWHGKPTVDMEIKPDCRLVDGIIARRRGSGSPLTVSIRICSVSDPKGPPKEFPNSPKSSRNSSLLSNFSRRRRDPDFPSFLFSPFLIVRRLGRERRPSSDGDRDREILVFLVLCGRKSYLRIRLLYFWGI